MASAPDLTLYLRDGGLVSILPSDVLVKPRQRSTGRIVPMASFSPRAQASAAAFRRTLCRSWTSLPCSSTRSACRSRGPGRARASGDFRARVLALASGRLRSLEAGCENDGRRHARSRPRHGGRGHRPTARARIHGIGKPNYG